MEKKVWNDGKKGVGQWEKGSLCIIYIAMYNIYNIYIYYIPQNSFYVI